MPSQRRRGLLRSTVCPAARHSVVLNSSGFQGRERLCDAGDLLRLAGIGDVAGIYDKAGGGVILVAAVTRRCRASALPSAFTRASEICRNVKVSISSLPLSGVAVTARTQTRPPAGSSRMFGAYQVFLFYCKHRAVGRFCRVKSA